jgi:hypothetical protein
MKSIFATMVASTVLLTVSAVAQNGSTYSGEIIDSQCALLGGHQNMIKAGEDAKACTNRCVGIGGKYVLFDSAKKATYQLDDQKKAKTMAGEKVTVSGTYDAATKTIKVATIKAQS